jgi:aryl-alcohol dehydrogenase-like predicted oxidoreductase
MQLCLGTAQFGMDYGVQGDLKLSKTKTFELLDKALEKGIVVFDTATEYGSAEAVLGEYISRNKHKHTFKIISKLPPQALQGVDVKDYFEVLDKAASESVKLLSCEKLDGYLFHNSKDVFNETRLRALSSLKTKGAIKNTGVSIYDPDEALAAANSEFVDYIQIPYNALDLRLDNVGFFQVANKNKKTIFARSAFLQGLLTMNLATIPAYAKHTIPIVKQFQSIANEFGLSSLEACLVFVKACTSIDYLIFGVVNPEQLIEIVTVFEKIQAVDQSYLSKIRDTFQNVEARIINPGLWRA